MLSSLWYNTYNVYVPTVQLTLGDMSHKDKPVTTSSIPPTKCCTKCGIEKPTTLEYFSAHPHGKYGLQARCRDCHNAAIREVNKHPEQRMKNNARKRTPEYRAKRREWRKTKERTESEREYQRTWAANWRINNPEKSHLSGRIHSAKRRAQQRNSAETHTAKDIELQYRSQNGKCWWCGCELNGKYEVDHRIPLSKGGSNGARNICCACVHCNRSKNARMSWQLNGRLL